MPVFVIATKDSSYEKIVSNIKKQNLGCDIWMSEAKGKTLQSYITLQSANANVPNL